MSAASPTHANHDRPRLSREQIDSLADEIAETSAQIDAATHTLLAKIRAFDAAEGWGVQGALSCAHWLTWRAGIGPAAAREQVRVARRLGELPLLDEALRNGEVSYSKVRAMTRVATAETEAALLDMARCSTAAQLEKICRLYRQVAGAAPDPELERTQRWVRARGADDGMVRITASLHPDEAARVMKAIDVSAEASGEAARADGLVALAEARLDDQAGSGRPPIEALVKVEVDAATLEGELEDGTGVSAEACRRLLCDAGVVPAAVDERGNPLAVGRRKRTVSTPLRRALRVRDKACCFPGCSHDRFVDAHHIEHWVDGGETTAENLILLCRRHHRFVHEYGFTIEPTDGAEVVFRDPAGRRVPAGGEAQLRMKVAHEKMIEALARNGITVSPTTNLPNWDGQPPDYPWVIDTLCRVAEQVC